MKNIFCTLMICAFALVSCNKDNSGKSVTETCSTKLEATITTSFDNIFDYAFTLDGKAITMTKTTNGNTITYSYSDNELHANGEVKCTVTVSSKADVSSLPEKCDFKASRNYTSSKTTSDGSTTIYLSKDTGTGTGLSYSKLVEKGKVSDKASFAAYIANIISVHLCGTMEKKN